MTELNSATQERLRAAGIDPSDWIRAGGSWTGSPSGGGRWRGDRCGCTDDRCIGYHQADQECGCLSVLIATYQRNQQADRIWNRYRDAVDDDDQDGYQDAWDQSEADWSGTFSPGAFQTLDQLPHKIAAGR